MPNPEVASRGRGLLRERVESAAAVISAIPSGVPALLTAPVELPRCLVTTGIGTSEGHARHLAEVAARFCGQPARFASTGSLSRGAPPGAENDWLIVFSQGLSANARHALTDPGRWAGVFLVTGLSEDTTKEDGLSDEKKDWLKDLSGCGVTRIDLGCGAEYGALIRVIGARAGYVVAWSLMRSLLERRLGDSGVLDLEVDRLTMAQNRASDEIARSFPLGVEVAPFFDAGRTLLVVGEEGALELVDQLTLKLAEGMLRPQPRTVDVLQFAHGPLQSLALRPTSILYLTSKHRDGEAAIWLDRFRSTLDPELHDLRVLEAELSWPFAAVEFEAMFDELVLRTLDETEADVLDWPGADREAALYDAGPRRIADIGARALVPRSARRFEEAVWPEVEDLIQGGRRTALLGLGSIEQHGPHLPLGTDRWIADSLLEGLAERLEDAIAIPAIAVGCASEHLDFPGTLHIEPETLEALLRDLLASLVRHGFERAFLFTAHGGNVDALGEMGDRLSLAEPGIELRIETDLRVGAMQSATVAAENLSPLAAGPHAGEYETSLVALLRPGTVRIEALRPGRIVEAGQAGGLFYPSLRPNTESGVLGDPSAAVAERGNRYRDAWLDLLEGAYRSAFVGSTEKKRQ